MKKLVLVGVVVAVAAAGVGTFALARENEGQDSAPEAVQETERCLTGRLFPHVWPEAYGARVPVLDVYAHAEREDLVARLFFLPDEDEAEETRSFVQHDDGGEVERVGTTVIQWVFPSEAEREMTRECAQAATGR